MTTVHGAWSDEANGWVSEVLELTGDAWLEVELPQKGRVVIKKAETMDGPWPKALITKWAGPEFRVRLFHGVDRFYGSNGVCGRYVKIVTTDIPKRIEMVNV